VSHTVSLEVTDKLAVSLSERCTLCPGIFSLATYVYG